MRLSRRLAALIALLTLAVLYVSLVLIDARVLRSVQVDLTAGHVYTLAPGTLRIAGSLHEPVDLYLYFSRHAARDLPQLRAYAQRVELLLHDIAEHAHGRIRIRVIDPAPYSDAEERAQALGLTPAPGGVNGGRIFFGIAGTNTTDGVQVIPFLQRDKESFLEYDVARMIQQLDQRQRPVIGLISSLPVQGGGADATPPWTAFRQLGQLFRVRPLDGATLRAIPADVKVLLLVQPAGLTPVAQRAIDRYVQQGGHVALFMDPDPESIAPADAQASAQATATAMAPLLTAWGITWNPDRVVLDSSLAQAISIDPAGAPVRDPAVLGLGRGELNRDDVITAGLSSINVSTAGSLELSEHAHTRLEPLLQSSGESEQVPVAAVLAAGDPSTLLDGFQPGGERYVIAARLTGALPAAFAGDAPVANAPPRPGEVLLVADTDLLSDRLWVQLMPLLGQTITNPFANNGDFFLNAMDNLAGSSALISIRGRALAARPFTRVEALRRQAEAAFSAKQFELQQQLNDTERRLADLEQARNTGGTPMLTAAQRGEIASFTRRRAEIRRQLREVQRSLDARIDRLGERLKLINIVLMPILVSLFAMAWALLRAWRRRRWRSEGR